MVSVKRPRIETQTIGFACCQPVACVWLKRYLMKSKSLSSNTVGPAVYKVSWLSADTIF